MSLQRFLKSRGLRFTLPLRRASPRHARRALTVLPTIACVPGGDVWFLRFSLGFLSHLNQGGRIEDRLRGRVVGDPAGRPFKFDHLRGGPLQWAPDLVPSGHVFIGHSICPGFSKIAARFSWWQATPFCAPGYDYFHDGFNYAQVPVDLAPHAFAEVSLRGVEAAAWAKSAQRSILLYSDPFEQAASYFNYSRSHPAPAYNTLAGRRLTDWKFRDYLLDHALPSYAKAFISYQAMANEVPGSVIILPHRGLRERPVETLASILNHLAGQPRDWPLLPDAVDLARREHMAAVEIALGRPLDRKRRGRAVATSDADGKVKPEDIDQGVRREGVAVLASLGMESQYLSGLAESAGNLPMTVVA